MVFVREDEVEKDVYHCCDCYTDRPYAAVDIRRLDGDAEFATSDSSNETWQSWDTAANEGSYGAKVETVSVEQLCTGTEAVEVDEVELAFTHEPEVGKEDAAGRTEEDRVAG